MITTAIFAPATTSAAVHVKEMEPISAAVFVGRIICDGAVIATIFFAVILPSRYSGYVAMISAASLPIVVGWLIGNTDSGLADPQLRISIVSGVTPNVANIAACCSDWAVHRWSVPTR